MSKDIWLSDAAIALAALPNADAQRILRLLGLEPMPHAEAIRPEHSASTGPTDEHPRPGPPTQPAPPPPTEPSEPGLLDRRRQRQSRAPTLAPVTVEPPPVEWPVEPLARPAPALPRPARPHEPLLAPRSTSALLAVALSRPVPEGEVDSAAAVDALAAARPVGTLPRSPLWTLRFGVQVLVDLGAGMHPFARDQLDLVDRLRRLFGPALVDVQCFAYAPLRGTGPGPRWTWTPYEPPPPDTGVLILSNFGIGGPPLDYLASERAEWEDFTTVLARRGCAATGFVPYPPARWPSWLRTRLPLVRWDRGTTVSTVRRLR